MFEYYKNRRAESGGGGGLGDGHFDFHAPIEELVKYLYDRVRIL